MCKDFCFSKPIQIQFVRNRLIRESHADHFEKYYEDVNYFKSHVIQMIKWQLINEPILDNISEIII